MDVLVISDQVLARAGVRAQLHAIDPQLRVGEAKDLSDAMAQLNAKPALRLIVLDLDMHVSRPLLNTVLLRELWPDVPLVVMASSPSLSAIQLTQDVGAAACVDKSADTALLRQTLRQVLQASERTSPTETSAV